MDGRFCGARRQVVGVRSQSLRQLSGNKSRSLARPEVSDLEPASDFRLPSDGDSRTGRGSDSMVICPCVAARGVFGHFNCFKLGYASCRGTTDSAQVRWTIRRRSSQLSISLQPHARVLSRLVNSADTVCGTDRTSHRREPLAQSVDAVRGIEHGSLAMILK